MAYVRSSGYRMKDPDDDAFAQVIVGDLERIALNLYRGSANTAYVLSETAANNLNISSGAAPSIATTTISSSTVRRALAPGLCLVKPAANYTYLTNTDTIIFTSAVDDEAECYNTVTGVFTAPVTGIYTISVFILNDFPNTPSNVRWNPLCYYWLRKNGVFECIAEYESDMTYGSASTGHELVVGLPLTRSMCLAQGDRITITNASAYENISSLYGRMDDDSFFSATWIPT